ncbi:hypothetical protein RI138_11525 [Streptomyces sp. C11-1]|uniref:DNA-binding protein n=1 Tax=Streptomyces durocortorensis TaxID=2811104 RepID=A0ABY9VU15_9ACTN|nr:hypothetical protein [Streptomyces durocortorensis]WNF27416.1 hypothetical protein RI138_11525 [Streptomyces durocortorensis]
MDTQHDIALAHALTGIHEPLPPSGVIHVAIPHTSRFTIVGNHLAQHAELSLTAIGIGVHIQSLPAGSQVGIKALTARFAEGETTIASALRELETHGYLHRTRVRLANGRMVTRTVFCNRPGALPRGGAVVVPMPVVAPPAPVPVGPPVLPVVAAAVPEPAPEPAPVPEESHPPVRVPPRTAPKPPRRPLPQPRELTPELRRASSALLADLRRHAEELVLCEQDIEELVPGVAAWLERDTPPDAIRHALTADLPQPPRSPAKLIRHRLTVLLPPPLPGTSDLTPVRRTVVIPLQNCDRCDHAFRATSPGHCRGCRSELLGAA